MPTIKDIAKMAKVSHGTVSNVLNGRGNVSVKKIKLVEEAAKNLGYQLNLQAKILKEGSAKTVSIILPNITSDQYANLYDGLFSELNSQGYDLALYLTHDSTERELQFIQKIAVKRDFAVIIVSCLAYADSYYQTVKTDKDKIIFVYRRPKHAKQFLSLNFEKAGQDIALEMITKKYKRIGLFSNSDNNTHSQMFKNGLITYFDSHNYPISLTHIVSTPSDSTYNLAFNFFIDPTIEFDAIITTDFERARYVRNASYLGCLKPCPPIYTLANSNFFYENNIHQYHMNYGVLSQKIVKMIQNQSITDINNKGFTLLHDDIFKKIYKIQEQVNFLILPSPSTNALKKLLPHFKKSSGININLVIKPFDEIYRILNHFSAHHDIDVIRIDMASLPWFAEKTFKPLSDLQIDLDSLFSSYSPKILERFSYVHDVAYAIPFDPSIQLLFYRKDLFSDPLVKRAYFEKYRKPLDIPVDFSQYNQISQFFSKQYNSDSPVAFGGCVTLGNAEIMASEFLLRYYAQGGKLVKNKKIQLNKMIALQTLVEFSDYIQIAKTINSNWWQESIYQYEKGNLAMLIVYMNLFSYITNKNTLPLIGAASVPGNKPLFGGGSLGMSKYSKKNDAVTAFFNWLYSKEISEQIALLGGTVMGDTIFQNQRIMDSYPWLHTANDNYLHGIRENYLDHYQAIDLRNIENILGKYLSDWIKGKYTNEQVIDVINCELK